LYKKSIGYGGAMKKNFIILIGLVFLISSCQEAFLGPAGPSGNTPDNYDSLYPFAGGSGTQSDPYKIATAAHLNNIRDYLNNSNVYFIQIKNIDLTNSPFSEGKGWTPIGKDGEPFKGHYNGNNKKITGLYINNNIDSLGLFGVTDGASFKNMVLENFYMIVYAIDDEISAFGPLVGWAKNTSFHKINVNNLFLTGAIVGLSPGIGYFGGLVGWGENSTFVSIKVKNPNMYFMHEDAGTIGGIVGILENSTLNDCQSTGGSIVKGSGIGGLVGYLKNGEITNSFSNIALYGDPHCAGGLIGSIYTTTQTTIKNSYTTGIIEAGGDSVGGLIGQINGMDGFETIIINCYSTKEIEAQGNSIGGFIGEVNGELNIENCYAKGPVKGQKKVGGFIGEFSPTKITLKNSYATGEVIATEDDAGGFIGQIKRSVNTLSNTIENSYATGNVEGKSNVGGFIGNIMNSGGSVDININNCYSIGNITGMISLGGFIGSNSAGAGVITNCYYDEDTSGKSDTGKGEPRSTSDMRKKTTYTSWDFTTIWKINEGVSYPIFKWQ